MYALLCYRGTKVYLGIERNRIMKYNQIWDQENVYNESDDLELQNTYRSNHRSWLLNLILSNWECETSVSLGNDCCTNLNCLLVIWSCLALGQMKVVEHQSKLSLLKTTKPKLEPWE